MARYLISTMPAAGHVNPMRPLAAALTARGHEVWWHTGRAYAAAAEEAGARFAPFDRTPDFEQIPVRPDPGARGLAAVASVLRRLFIDRIPGQVADYERLLGAFQAAALGLALMLWPTPLYPSYAGPGREPADDQALGGVLMWAVTAVVDMALVMALVWRFLEAPGAGRSAASAAVATRRVS